MDDVEVFQLGLGDRDPAIRCTAVNALGRLEVSDHRVEQAIRGALGDPEANVRRDAAWALGRRGCPGEPNWGALALLLNDPDAGVRFWAATALARLGAVAVLRQHTAHPDPAVRVVAAQAIKTDRT